MHAYDVTVNTTAPPATVFTLLLDATTWPVWSCVDSLDTERSVGLDPDGRDTVGAVRAFRTGRMVTGERLTAIEQDRRLSYEDAFNPILRDYRVDIDITPTGNGGTSIRWRGTYSTRWGMGWFMQRYLQRFMRKMADGLAPTRRR